MTQNRNLSFLADLLTTSGVVNITGGGTGQTTASAGFNALSPVTSTGDLIIGNGTNSSTRLAIGTNGTVLTSNGTTASWSTPSANVTTSGNNAFTGANTFYNNTGQTIGTATTSQDGIILSGRAGGSSSYRVTIQPTTLSASQTLTLPDSTTTIAGLSTTQTFTSQNKFNNFIDVNNAVTVTSNAGTIPVTYRLNTFTNSSAAAMSITMATASAVDGQMTIVRIYDFSAAAQTISWTNTENSSVTVPTTSNGSTTLPLTVGFMYNGQTSKWRCIASA